MKKIRHIFMLVLALTSVHAKAQQLAFPSAEGYGKFAKGGRGGTVYEVTNLNDRGEGSLRAAVEAEGPRTVVFRTSGTITLEQPLRIKHPYLTIAGQTAPGDGICIKKYPVVIEADHVILRYLRVRLGNESGEDLDAVSSRYTKNIILDHISASWSVDETMSVYHCDSITVQYCIISESMFNSNHIKGAHGFGGIWGGDYSSYHHNLLAHHGSRNPRMASGSGHTDYRNNVVYNWGYNSCYGGENQQVGNEKYNKSLINMVGNYYKPGPGTEPGTNAHRLVAPSMRKVVSDFGKWYVAENVLEGSDAVTLDNWKGGVQPTGGEANLKYVKLDEPWTSMPIRQHTAVEAYQLVLAKAGASLPRRDKVDQRIINEVRQGTATYEGSSYRLTKKLSDPYEKTGIIDSQVDVGGWPVLKTTAAPSDTDHDGMPDDWELKYKLDPHDPKDGNRIDGSGYTMLELYLNKDD
ncbi:pectate lyase family protein [Dyadobacter tibetensis]|uniref:pectate lyase family protein n=1 Tax=Dyadobacter tibetensis TaxID=1211851 RepID=UPI0004AFF416|nr:pectate lyase [Dyadobacter tibetensis]